VAAGELTIENAEVAEQAPVARYVFCKQVFGAAHAVVVSSLERTQVNTTLWGF